jgi:hypothetical protein
MPKSFPPRPRVCIFCGPTQSPSEEHIFSKWMKKYLPHAGWHQFHHLEMPAPNRLGANLREYRQGGTNILRPKIVCRRCNNGWMSLIETQAKGCLIPLMAGGQFIMTEEHQRKLSIWATLKSMVHEHVRATVCSPDDHRDFMQTAQPSIQWSIWIGKCLSPEWRVRIIAQAFTLAPTQTGMHKIRNIEFFTIALNELLIHLRLNKSAVPPPAVPDGLFRVWPAGEPVVWPPLRILSGNDADLIGTSLARWLGAWPRTP